MSRMSLLLFATLAVIFIGCAEGNHLGTAHWDPVGPEAVRAGENVRELSWKTKSNSHMSIVSMLLKLSEHIGVTSRKLDLLETVFKSVGGGVQTIDDDANNGVPKVSKLLALYTALDAKFNLNIAELKMLHEDVKFKLMEPLNRLGDQMKKINHEVLEECD